VGLRAGLDRCGKYRPHRDSIPGRRITVGRTPLEESAASRRDFYLTTHNTDNRETSMPTVVFEPTVSADELLQTYT